LGFSWTREALWLVLSVQRGRFISILLGQGNGSFAEFGTVRMLSGSLGGFDLELPDLNGDGMLDLVAAGGTTGTSGEQFIAVRYGRGDGAFGGRHLLAVPRTNPVGPHGFAIGDTDGDGDLQIVTANFNEFTLSILENKRGVARPQQFTYEPAFDQLTSATDQLGRQGHTAPYRLFLPRNYSPDQAYPLVLYMHGAGEQGRDNLRQLNGVDALIAATQSEQYASYLLAPQMDAGVGWSSDLGYDLTRGVVDQVLGAHVVDTTRVYATGFSAGGTGTIAQVHDSDLYAAGVPIASGLNGLTPEFAEELAPGYVDMPLWVFHGALDVFWPAEKARLLVDAIRAAGGLPLYTEFPDYGHGIRSLVYEDSNDELYRWLFSQQRLPEPSSGDFDLDGEVDGSDFLAWQRGESPRPLSADDLADWQVSFGADAPLSNAVGVPAPSSMLLASSGAIGVALIRRRHGNSFGISQHRDRRARSNADAERSGNERLGKAAPNSAAASPYRDFEEWLATGPNAVWITPVMRRSHNLPRERFSSDSS
jgi:acetyl esterase/lipase